MNVFPLTLSYSPQSTALIHAYFYGTLFLLPIVIFIMAWKSSFQQNYRTTFSPTVPTSAAGISHVVADVEAPGGEKWEHLKKKKRRKAMASYP